jgi:hypothetical protein
MAKHPAGDKHRDAARKHDDASKAHHKAANAHDAEQHDDAKEHAESAHLHSQGAHEASDLAKRHGQPGEPQRDARGQPLSDRQPTMQKPEEDE